MKKTKMPKTNNVSPSISEVYDIIAESFDSKRKHPWEEVTTFISKIAPGKFVLDLGSGNGRHSRILIENDIEAIGYDISLNILKTARENELQKVKERIFGLINGDARYLAFRSSSLDGFIMIAVIHHFESDEQRKLVLNEIKRVLRRNGVGLISCWQRTHPRFKKSDLVEQIAKGEKDVYVPWVMPNGEKIERYYYLFDPEELMEIVEEAGLSIIKSEISHHNLFLTVKKE